jgi:hypothetical protein
MNSVKGKLLLDKMREKAILIEAYRQTLYRFDK